VQGSGCDVSYGIILQSLKAVCVRYSNWVLPESKPDTLQLSHLVWRKRYRKEAEGIAISGAVSKWRWPKRNTVPLHCSAKELLSPEVLEGGQYDKSLPWIALLSVWNRHLWQSLQQEGLCTCRWMQSGFRGRTSCKWEYGFKYIRTSITNLSLVSFPIICHWIALKRLDAGSSLRSHGFNSQWCDATSLLDEVVLERSFLRVPWVFFLLTMIPVFLTTYLLSLRCVR
jgi:hypothetical protein